MKLKTKICIFNFRMYRLRISHQMFETIQFESKAIYWLILKTQCRRRGKGSKGGREGDEGDE